MTRPIIARITAAGIAILWIALTAPATEASNKHLSQNYSYTVGDDIAARTAGLFRVVAGLEASSLVFYDRKEQNIVAYIVGSAEDVEGAERELDGFVSAVKEYLVPYAKKQHGLDITESDVTLIYYNDGGDASAFEMVRREGGKFKVPPEPKGDEKE